MKMIEKCLMLLFILTMLTGVVFAAEDAEGSKDHPLFNRMPGYFIDDYSQKDFMAEEFRSGNKTVTVEGRYYLINYRSTDDDKYPSTLQVLRNYINAVQKIGGQLLFQDESEAHLRVAKNGGETWIKVVVKDDGWQYDLIIVEKAGMEQSIVANAVSLANSLQETGKALLYGIYFDSGKAIVKQESEPSLQQIAKLMKENPKLILFVVGHTDNVGKISLNLQLSQERATAVVKALTTKYGVDPARLSAYGVGPLAPVASNKDEAGRELNRRVELVQQ
jgi:OOP family OmpA-OmpF porin